MVAQTEMTGNGRNYDSVEASDRGHGLAHDIISLIELQSKLFAADCRESVSRLVTAAVSVVIAILLILGSIPLLLAAFAQLLVSLLGMPVGWALFASAVIAILIAGGLGLLGWYAIKRAGRVFLRSGRELGRNMKWMKEALKSPSTPRKETEPFESEPLQHV